MHFRYYLVSSMCSFVWRARFWPQSHLFYFYWKRKREQWRIKVGPEVSRLESKCWWTRLRTHTNMETGKGNTGRRWTSVSDCAIVFQNFLICKFSCTSFQISVKQQFESHWFFLFFFIYIELERLVLFDFTSCL